MAEPGTLTRGHVRSRLVMDLAADVATRAHLAQEYGVSRSAISQFARRHHLDIAQARERIEDRYAALWIADKFNRVAELQQMFDQMADLMSDPASAARAGVQAAEMYRAMQTTLRNVAEELGQLPNRTTVQHEGSVSVRYELCIGGFDAGLLS